MQIQTLLNESVDFSPALQQYPVESELQDMIGISSHIGRLMLNKFLKDYPFFQKYVVNRWKNHDMAIRVDMDGTDDYDKRQGTINIYVKSIPPQYSADLKALLKQTVDYVKTHFDVGKVSFEGSRPPYKNYDEKKPRTPFTKGMKLEELEVIRIPLLSNKSSEYVAPPSLNVSNVNAGTVAAILGSERVTSHDDNSGMIKLKDIPRVLMRLRNLADGKLDALQRDDSVDRGDARATKNTDGTSSIARNGPTVHHIGLSRARIDQYVGKLIEILEYCVTHKVDFSWG